MALIKQLPKNAKLVFVGDLMDRSPDSEKVLEFVKEGGHSCIMGNHEKMFLEVMDTKQGVMETIITTKLWLQNGGTETQESIDNYFSKEELEVTTNRIASLPSFLEYNIPDENEKPSSSPMDLACPIEEECTIVNTTPNFATIASKSS